MIFFDVVASITPANAVRKEPAPLTTLRSDTRARLAIHTMPISARPPPAPATMTLQRHLRFSSRPSKPDAGTVSAAPMMDIVMARRPSPPPSSESPSVTTRAFIRYLLRREAAFPLFDAAMAGFSFVSSRSRISSALTSSGSSVARRSSKVQPEIEPIRTRATARAPAPIRPQLMIRSKGRKAE